MSPFIFIIILIFPLLFLTNLIFKKLKIGNDRNRIYISIGSSIVLSPLVYFCVIMIWLFCISYYPSIDFDKAKWHSNIEKRYQMSQNIIDNELLISKKMDEVVDLLGSGYSSFGENVIGYYLGFVPGLANIDPDYLLIYFENGSITKVIQV